MILGLSSRFQLDGAPLNASTAACVGTCLYGTLTVCSGSFSFSADLVLCSFAAFLDITIFENTDIVVVEAGVMCSGLARWAMTVRYFMKSVRPVTP